jgi:hypothetical protein
MTMSADGILARDLPRTARAPAADVIVLPVVMDRLDETDWDRLVAGFDGAVQEQLAAFAGTRWPGVDLEPRVFRVDGEVVAGCLMMIQPLPFRLGAVAVAKWGPILKDNAREDADAVYAGAMERLIEEYARERKLMLSVLPRASAAEPNPHFEILTRRGFAVGSGLSFPNRYVVDLKLSDDEQRKSFAQKWRYHLNKSMKAGLEFEHANAAGLEIFDTLYQAMSDRKRFPDHSAYDTVRELFDIADEALRPELFLVRHEGEVIAGAIIFKAGDTAVYLYGATNEKALPLRAGYYLHWEIIRWLRDNTSACWYDLGGTDGFQGLHQFKKGMVGDAGYIHPVPPMTSYAEDPRARLLGSAAFLARDAAAYLRQTVERMRAGMAKPDQGRD